MADAGEYQCVLELLYSKYIQSTRSNISRKIKQNLEIISEPDLFDAFANSYVLFLLHLPKKAKVSILISHENIKIHLCVIS